VVTPLQTLVPRRVVTANWPPENCPRDTSYVLVNAVVARTASSGTAAPPYDAPSSVTPDCDGGWPAMTSP
jgi:hypothetical protein